MTLALDEWWKGLFALPATPHYVALFAWGSYVNGTVSPVDGSASAVDVDTLPFYPRVQVRRYDGS